MTQIIAVSLVGLCLAFAGTRLLARRIANYGIVDIAWAYGFAGVILLCATCGSGWPVRRWLLAVMVLIWSLRLGTHLLIRVSRHHPREDSRYAQLRNDWGDGFESKMTGFFQLQAVSIVLLSIPFFAACRNPERRLQPAEWTGILLWIAGIAGEALADAQLSAFRADASHRGRICQDGLWGFSRHPNYFFEWVVWVGYFAFACGSPRGWIAILSPACMLYLLLRVTGVPMAEEQSLRSKGDAYRLYQKTTSSFVPWFPKRTPQA